MADIQDLALLYNISFFLATCAIPNLNSLVLSWLGMDGTVLKAASD
jgi:hypothetical protein